MTITFDNDNDVIVFALEKIISHARRIQQIFVAQCVWWLASIIGLEQGLVIYIDNIQSRVAVTVASVKTPVTVQASTDGSTEEQQDRILKECEEYLKDSQRLRDITTLKSKGKTQSGRINPTQISKKNLRKMESKTAGINKAEIQRRKSAGECLCCAWPSHRKGTHRVKDCIRPIKLDKGTASYPRAKVYQKQSPLKPRTTSSISSEDEDSSSES
jgi:hypothetical protein